jgi:hypothetical protein
MEHGFPKTGDQIIQRDDPLAGFPELANDMTADVPGTACHENSVFAHFIPPI